MGTSMSNPDRFKQINKQRHLLAYQRKKWTQISLDSKIKFKTISSFPSNNQREKSQNKPVMIRQQKTLEHDFILPNTKKKINENKQELREKLETAKRVRQNQQNDVQIIKPNADDQPQKTNTKISKAEQSLLLNSEYKKSSIRKIVLNNQSYEIDVEKMKNRRLKSKERYSKIMMTNGTNTSKLNPSNTKQSFTTNSVPKGVSTLELESQLNPIIQQTANMEGTQEYLEMKIYFRQKSRERIAESCKKEQNQQQKVRAEYFDEYLCSFESKQSRVYQQKVKKSVSDKKLMKTHKIIKTEKQVPRMQENYSFSEYEIRSEKKILSKKSQNTASSIQTLTQGQTALLDLQHNGKKPLRVIKVHKNKDPSSKLSLNQ